MVKVNYKLILDRLLMVWVVCYGTIAVQTLSGYFLAHVWLPYIGFLLMVLVIVFGSHNLSKTSINCSLMTHYTVYTLGVSGLIMLIANLLKTNFISNNYSEFANHNYPFHVSFIIYPVAAVFYGIAMLRQSKPEYCHACKEMAAFSIRESLQRNLLHNEAKSQIRLAFGISLGLAIMTYGYYFIYYRSNSLSRVISPDIFFMYIVPVATYLMSVLYFLTKYSGLQFEMPLTDSFEDNKRTTTLRFMIVGNDRILLKEKVYDEFGSIMWDTPAIKKIDFYENIPIDKAKDIFIEISGAKHFSIRRLFSSNSKFKNINHYAVFMSDDETEIPALGGKWFSLREIDAMLTSGLVARPFAIEMHRVHTITMAWKTYDREGCRLYPIKNYRPAFRLRDFKNWNVDYEDLHWLNVWENNQDKPFFKMRRFWRRHISGIESKWNGKSS